MKIRIVPKPNLITKQFKMKDMNKITGQLFLSLFTVACFTACSSEIVNEEKNTVDNDDLTGLTEFAAGDDAATSAAIAQSKGAPFIIDNDVLTRTGASYQPGASASVKGANVFYWTGTDGVWVEKTAGNYEKTSKTVVGNPTNKARFYLNGALNAAQYNIRYTGNSTSPNEVTFANKQIQDEPNNASRLGEYGDCGIAIATKAGGRYNFTLEHKASYLVLNPYSDLNLDINVGVRAVYVTADQALSGKFSFDNNGVNLSSRPAPTADNRTVAWFYQNEMSDRSDLSMAALSSDATVQIPSQENVSKNGIIIVLPPGEYTNFTIEYALIDPMTQGYGYYKQTFSGKVTLKPGQNRKIAKNFSLDVYDMNAFYMWDAAEGQYYWKGNEAQQPRSKVDATKTSGFAKSDTDPRWYSKLDGTAVAATSGATANVATRSASTALNVNEALWLVYKGEPMWDDDMMYIMKGHLYNGGIWVKNLKTIATALGKSEADLKQSFTSRSNVTADYRLGTTATENLKVNSVNKSGRPTKAQKANYIFLPAAGSYGKPKAEPHKRVWVNPGEFGHYWTSTAFDERGAYLLWFQKITPTSFSISVEKFEKEDGAPILNIAKFRKN